MTEPKRRGPDVCTEVDDCATVRGNTSGEGRWRPYACIAKTSCNTSGSDADASRKPDRPTVACSWQSLCCRDG